MMVGLYGSRLLHSLERRGGKQLARLRAEGAPGPDWPPDTNPAPAPGNS